MYNQPAAFVRALHGLLELYSDRTHRPGQTGKPPPLTAAYNVPRPVLRHILRELIPIASQEKEQTLALSQAMWLEPHYEFRILATTLLGKAPLEPPETVIEILSSWLACMPEDSILAVLLDAGYARLRQEYPDKMLAIAKEWLQETGIIPKQNAVQLLRPLAEVPNADHLPEIFHLVSPFIRRSPSALKPDLIRLLTAATTVSPQETAFVLRQNLQSPESPDAAWFIRQLLKNFPPKQKELLKAALANQKLERTVL